MKTRYKVLIAGVIAVYTVLILFWVVPLKPDTLETQLRLRGLSYLAVGLVPAAITHPNAINILPMVLLLLLQSLIFIYLIRLWAVHRNSAGVFIGGLLLCTHLSCGTLAFVFASNNHSDLLQPLECRLEGENRFLYIHLVRIEADVERYVFFSSDAGQQWKYIHSDFIPFNLIVDQFSASCSQVASHGTEVTFYVDRYQNTLWLISTSDGGRTWQEWIAKETDVPVPDWCREMATIPRVFSTLIWSIQFRCSSNDSTIIRTVDGGRTWDVWGYVRRGRK